MLPKWTIYALKYFSLWGFHSVRCIRVGGTVSNLVIFYFQLSLCCWCSFHILKMYKELSAIVQTLDVVNIISYYITCSIIYMSTVYDSRATLKIQKKFWCTYSRLNQHFCHQSALKWDYLLMLTMATIGNVINCVLAYTGAIIFHGSQTSKATQFIYMNIIDHRITFYILHLEIIANQFRQIDVELEQSQTSTIKLHAKWFRKIRESYDFIHKMSDWTNDIFGLSNLALLLYSSQTLLMLLNFSYRFFNSDFFHIAYMCSTIVYSSRIAFHLYCYSKYTNECSRLVISIGIFFWKIKTNFRLINIVSHNCQFEKCQKV